jgi:nucleoid-associated protein YgaU
VGMPKNPTAVVNRGDSLWRISRITYGDGARYAVVYKANRELIRNPNRIYPGQIFVLPIKTP